ncbi:MAG: hypothetical protein Q8889_02580, partial [Candidatus Phytoplasma australasiaticum]|nr:hypothetical protein [Candidatus Phytoplasma australasiaticum]
TITDLTCFNYQKRFIVDFSNFRWLSSILFPDLSLILTESSRLSSDLSQFLSNSSKFLSNLSNFSNIIAKIDY